MLAIICISILLCLNIWVDLQFNRDKLNFDEIATDSPLLISPSQITGKIEGTASKAGESSTFGFGNLNGTCIGEACCQSPLVYDSSNAVCVSATESFTMRTDSSFNHVSNALPYTPSEYDLYNKV